MSTYHEAAMSTLTRIRVPFGLEQSVKLCRSLMMTTLRTKNQSFYEVLNVR